ncbi:MAG TPA: transglutaminase family protein [Isosphaeraceae bacterium]|jgi:transglutaminase-like putative cysteine protease
MLLTIRHVTTLTYSEPVAETIFEVRMAPPSDDDQTALGYRLKTTPQAPVTSYRDGFGNRVDLFNVASPYTELVVEATSYVRTHRRPCPDRLAGAAWPVAGPVAVEAIEYLQPSLLVDRGPALDAFVAGLSLPPGSLADALLRLMAAGRARLAYEKTVTSARTPVSEALALGRGVCQDLSHLFLGACRALGRPARYVSGYVHHPGELATHAWCQVWAGEPIGWVDVDPTRGDFCDDDHIVTAIGRDYADVPPNRGLYRGKAQETIAVTVTVERIDRVPPEWNDWAQPGYWPAFGAATQFQRQGAGFQFQSQRPMRGPFPDQQGSRAGLHQQQGQQQQ